MLGLGEIGDRGDNGRVLTSVGIVVLEELYQGYRLSRQVFRVIFEDVFQLRIP